MKFVLPALLLIGCSRQSSFGKDFVDAYCAAYDSCNTSGRPCPVRLEDQAAYKVCDFDNGLAETCLSGPFTCNNDVEAFEVIEAPSACLSVCGGVQ